MHRADCETRALAECSTWQPGVAGESVVEAPRVVGDERKVTLVAGFAGMPVGYPERAPGTRPAFKTGTPARLEAETQRATKRSSRSASCGAVLERRVRSFMSTNGGEQEPQAEVLGPKNGRSVRPSRIERSSEVPESRRRHALEIDSLEATQELDSSRSSRVARACFDTGSRR